MSNFTNFGLPETVLESLKKMKITIPTPIQSATIPVALTGTDILASAKTGTGKTIAYLIPLIIHLSTHQNTALILTPTRELAMQVHQTLNQILGTQPSFKTALLIGGMPMFKQFSDLKKQPRLIVGTPGRITDHLMRNTLSLKLTRFLVIDEADRMLDMGFGIQLKKIADYLPAQKQTLMFSATISSNIERLSKQYLKEPQRISIDSSNEPAPTIKQEMIRTSMTDKLPQLLKQLAEREGSVIIFVKTKRGAERLSKELNHHGHNTSAIHGDLPQRRRDHVVSAFRTRKSRVMVATDVAARGLDIPHVMHVINYDLPQSPEDYIHRIGRTGRAGMEGNALCLVSPEDGGKWRAIFNLMNPTSQQKEEWEPKRSSFKRTPRAPSRGRFRNQRRFK